MVVNENRSYYDARMNHLHPSSEPTAGLPPGSPLPPLPATLVPSMDRPRWRSEELLAGREEALIAHGDQVYRLRRTGTGKLILTK
jgi:hemin uptake protein HemP